MIHHYSDIPWHVPPLDPSKLDLDTAPQPGEAGRKFLVQGESGFYVQAVSVPANFDAPLHSHDHAEVFMVVAGSCTFNGGAMGPLDCTVVASNQPYGFTAGPDGVQFLVTRNGVAKFRSEG